MAACVRLFLQPPPPEPILPDYLTVCCDANVTFEASPAKAFFPTRFKMSSAYVDGNITVSFLSLLAQFDTTYLAFVAPDTFQVKPIKFYTGPVKTSITWTLPITNSTHRLNLTSSVNVTILDVRTVIITPSQPVLHRIHCSDLFERTNLTITALIDYLDAPLDITYSSALGLSNPTVATLQNTLLTGIRAGFTDIVGVWQGVQFFYNSFPVLDESMPYAYLSCPPHSSSTMMLASLDRSLYLPSSCSQITPISSTTISCRCLLAD